MLEENIRNELSLLISHYLREKHPEVYSEFEKFCNDNKILPEGCKSVSEALNLRYKNTGTLALRLRTCFKEKGDRRNDSDNTCRRNNKKHQRNVH